MKIYGFALRALVKNLAKFAATSFTAIAACSSFGFESGEKIPDFAKDANWISSKNFDYDLHNLYTLFAKSFTLDTTPEKAELVISAEQAYRLYINGLYVSSGPARGYQVSQPCDVIDVAKYLKAGKNRVAVRVYSPGRSSFAHRTEGFTGLFFALDLGGKKILSDRTWKSVRQEGCSRDTMPFSLQITGNQEQVDLRVESQNWFRENFDDSKWNGIDSCRPYNSQPFYTLETRGTKMLKEDEIVSPKLIAEASGKSKNSDRFVRNICALLLEEGVAHSPAGGAAETAKAGATGESQFKSYIFDFGKTVVGMPILEVSNANGGEIVDIQFCEWIGENFTPRIDTFTHSKISLADRIVCDKGSNYWQFFHSMGFRYALVRVRNSTAANLEVAPKLRYASYPLDGSKNFECSNDYVMKIWNACRNGQRVCSLDSYVDTPWREQTMWWGDARVQSWNTFMLENDPALLRRGIRIMTGQIIPNGLMYGHAPTIAHDCVLPDYNLIWILTLWDYYWQTGDISEFAKNLKTIDGLLGYFDSVTDPKTALAKYDERYWLFLDWTNIQKNGAPTVLNLWLLYTLDKLADMAKIADMPEKAKEYAQRADTLRKAAQKLYVNSDMLVCDGILPDGVANKNTSVHAQVLGKMCNLEFDFEKAKKEIILPYLKGAKKKDSPSAYWSVYVLQLMLDEGYAKECYDFIKENWAQMAEYGCTFEDFNTRNSLSHAWSAHPLFMIPRILLGVRQEAPAWKKISVKPNFLEKSAKAVYPTPQGKITAEFGISEDGKQNIKVDAPQGVEVIKKN